MGVISGDRPQYRRRNVVPGDGEAAVQGPGRPAPYIPHSHINPRVRVVCEVCQKNFANRHTNYMLYCQIIKNYKYTRNRSVKMTER